MPVSRCPFSTQIVQQLILGLPRKGAIRSEAVFPLQCTKSRQSLRGVPWRPAPEMILGSVGLTVNTSQSPLHLCFLLRRPAFLTQPSNWKPLESTSLEWHTAFSLCSSPQLKTAEAVIRSGKRETTMPRRLTSLPSYRVGWSNGSLFAKGRAEEENCSKERREGARCHLAFFFKKKSMKAK